jgi:hydroxymethylpyrimidine pyrophosphatase-like HAD family hydrolase
MTAYPNAKETISTIGIERDAAFDVLEEVIAHEKLQFVVITPWIFHYSHTDAPIPTKYEHWNIERDQIDSIDEIKDDVLEIIATGGFYSINALFDYVDARYHDDFKLRIYESRKKSDLWFLEIRSIHATKGAALERLVEKLDIPFRDVVGIGDHRNDIDFCRQAGFVVTVNNAIDEIKEMADIITTQGCLDEGINEFFELFLRTRGIEVVASPKVFSASNQRRRTLR